MNTRLGLIRANFREAVRSLLTARQRTILAIIGVVIGIGSVIGMVSIGEIVMVQALSEFTDLGTDIVSVKNGSPSDSAGPAFDATMLERLPAQVSGIREVAPYVVFSPEWICQGQSEIIQLFGANEAFFLVNRLRLAKGRLVSRLDAGRFFCVAGADVAKMLHETTGRDPIGTSIQLSDRIYTVVGVLEPVPDGGSIRPGGINDGIIVALATALRVARGRQVQAFVARVGQGMDAGHVKTAFQTYFSARGKNFDLEINTAAEIINAMQKQMMLYTLLLGAVGSIALVVGGIGVMNVMLISVSERRSEIGIRRALGAQESDIRWQFLVEAIVLCMIGGLLGIAFGVGTSWIFARSQQYAFVVSGWAILLGFTVSTIVGVFFGFYPARRASRLDPIAALRS